MPNAWGGATPVEVADGSDYELGTEYEAVVDITIHRIRVWSGVGELSYNPRRARIWSTVGVELGIAVLPDNLPDGWSEHDLIDPVEITAGTNFVVSYSTGGNYGIVAGALNVQVDSADGNVHTVAAGVAINGNGIFNNSPSLFPNTASGAFHFYGPDFVYELGFGDSTPPVINSLELARTGNMATVTVNATDAETLVGATYRFNWGDGTADTITNYPTNAASHVYTATGTYAILVTVTDADGLTDTAAIAVSVTVFAPGRELMFYMIPNTLLNAIEAALATTIGGPMNRACVVPGAIAWDECECGALYVSVSRWFLSDTFPASQSADQRVGPCELTWLVAEITIQVMRCAPTAAGRNVVAPTCEALDNAAKIMVVDAYTTLTTTLSTLCGMKQDNLIIDFSLGEQTASGPEGMCVGTELRAYVAMPR